MLIVMEEAARAEETSGVLAALAARECDARVVGRAVVVVRGRVEADEIARLAGVESVAPIASAYKLVARAVRPEGTVVRIGGVEIGGREFVVAAGPCAVEDEEQMSEVSAAVAASGARVLRGGAYKPRTSPYSFQGLGEEGLVMLADAGRASGLPVVTEVMSEEDVPLVASYADALQVGARNVQNFALLRALGTCGKPVLLKRGMSTTVEELLMSAEYVVASGNPDVILCERGIRTFETTTRNTLDLNSVPVLKALTHLPVLVDPSHGTGRRELIAPLSKAAAAAGADGLIIEVHPAPERALSDGPQSLTPAMFASLMRDLAGLLAVEGRSLAASSASTGLSAMGAYRDGIDAIDEAILRLLNERAELALRIGRIKTATGRPVRVPEREAAVIERAVNGSLGGALDAGAVARLFEAIISETRAAEEARHVA